MPLYEYDCKEHGTFEVLYASPFSDGTLEIKAGKLTVGHVETLPPKVALCPKCKAPSPRLVSAHAKTPGKWKVNG